MLTSSLRRASINANEVSISQARHASSSSAAARPDFANLTSRVNARPSRPDSKDLRKINNTTRHLLLGMKQSNNPEWRHTNGRKDESVRLRQEMLSRKQSQATMPKQLQKRSAFQGHDIENLSAEDFLEGSSSPLQPGTYYEVRRYVRIFTVI